MKSRVKQIAKKTVAIVDNNIVLAIAILHETVHTYPMLQVALSWYLMWTLHQKVIKYDARVRIV